MDRTDIKTIAQNLAFSELPSIDTLDRYLSDVFDILGLSAKQPPCVQAALKAFTLGVDGYTFEADILRIIYMLFSNYLMHPVNERELNVYDSTWYNDSNDNPRVYVIADRTARTYTVYPPPAVNSSAYIPTVGEPFGDDYPANNAVIIYSDNRITNIPDIYALPSAFDALAKEFTYPSDHEDTDFAAGCEIVSNLLYALVGLK